VTSTDQQEEETMDKIVVGIDGGEQQPDALALAATLAELEGAEVVLAHVYPWDPAAVAFGPAYAETVERDARELADSAKVQFGRPAEARAEPATSPARGLVELAEREGADLLVLGACHRGPIGRTILGSASDRVLHAAPCAVAVAPRGYAGEEHALRSIAVAYDGAEESRAALAWAAERAQRVGATLTLYTVVEPPILRFPGATQPSYATVVQGIRDLRRRQLDEALAGLPGSLEARGELLEASPGAVLGTATTEHDLLVMGSRGYGPIGNVALGGVSRDVLHHAACPVVVLARAAVRTEPSPQELAGQAG
jgi:nucleotide-binding universal stress UspA family protein